MSAPDLTKRRRGSWRTSGAKTQLGTRVCSPPPLPLPPDGKMARWRRGVGGGREGKRGEMDLVFCLCQVELKRGSGSTTYWQDSCTYLLMHSTFPTRHLSLQPCYLSDLVKLL